jgi:hypothetical protein
MAQANHLGLLFSQAGIARVLQVSEDTVQRYVNSQTTAVKE